MISGHFRHLQPIVVVLLLGLAVVNLNLPRITAAGLTAPARYQAAPLSQLQGACTPGELVQDGGLEAGLPNPAWQTASNVFSSVLDDTTTPAPHTGTWKAWLGGDNLVQESLWQTITVPAGTASLQVSYWWRVDTFETAHPFDTLEVQIRDGAGSLVQTLATLTDGDAHLTWQQSNFAVTGYAGQSIQIAFVAQTDGTSPTNFFIDDVSVLNTCASTPTATPTASPTASPTATPTTPPTTMPTSTMLPTATRTVSPTATPTASPTASPTATPTTPPTTTPTPTMPPTATRTVSPTATPTASPTASPTATPTTPPTASPTTTRTVSPTATPTASPTASPTATPTASPTASPTTTRTVSPTATPTASPTASPTATPTASPTASPTATPTAPPTTTPTPPMLPTATRTASPTVTPTAPASVTISKVRVTDVRDTTFTVSWVTNQPAGSGIDYGTDPLQLDQVAADSRIDDTHLVVVKNLNPETTYYFDVVSGNSQDDNGGNHYQVTTGPTIPPTAPHTAYGHVFKTDGTTPAEGALVYVIIRDGDGQGSSVCAPMMAQVDASGIASLNLANARSTDLTTACQYSASGDTLELAVEGGADGSASRNQDTGAVSPWMPPVVLSSLRIWYVPVLYGWTFVALPGEPAAGGYTAQSLIDEINQQGGQVVEIARWENSNWESHIDGQPFNNFAVELGRAYFLRAVGLSTWTFEGHTVAEPVPLQLVTGWNGVGFPNPGSVSQASDVCAAVPAVVELAHWENSSWESHLCGQPFNDFALAVGRGYFVRTNGSATWPTRAPADALVQTSAVYLHVVQNPVNLPLTSP